MARILIAWEQGDNYGHLLRFRDLIQTLLAAGDEVVFYAKRLDLAERIYGASAVRLEPIPRLDPPRSPPRPGFESLVDILLGTAFHDVAAASLRVRQWQRILAAERPDTILFDFSPTAMLANRSCRIPAIACGNSFYNPPQLSPLPPYRAWLPHDAAALQRRETELLGRLNQSRPSDTPALDTVADLFLTERMLLHTFPEFD
ncbi:MAG: hypothetical protein IT494_09650 [Gammaproteobacteria bacterium]|nr:hypothetical protein [Gammaproteobacteria bacterium]